MNRGIAKVSGNRIPAVSRMNALEVLRHLVKCFVPADALPTTRRAAHWILDPVFVVVKIGKGGSLRADVPTAEGIRFVAADVEVQVGLNRYLDTADRFAQIAGAVMRGAIGTHGGTGYPQITQITQI